MASKNYTTLQDILEEAGLANDVHAETPSGLIDGENSTITVANKPLTDGNYDDKVDSDDVKVYVNGVPVTVSEVDAQFGTITLAKAPKTDDEVAVDYRYSAVSLRFVENLRAEAEATINNRMRNVDNCSPYGQDGKDVPSVVSGICRHLAAAWLLVRDYGFNQDIEDTSKDGYKRLDTVMKTLEDYANNGGECGDDGSGGTGQGIGAVAASSDGDLFPAPHFDKGYQPDKDW